MQIAIIGSGNVGGTLGKRWAKNGHNVTFKLNYRDVAKQKNLAQNVELKPGDTILVP